MQTHTTIKRTLDARNLAATLELLEQCQNCAIGLGEKIEAMEGEGFPTISLLENYCEVLYQIYEKVLQSAGINSNQVHNTLAKELIRIGNSIKNSIKNDIHIRSEAVFLPYKASMWDSLESIWKAAVLVRCTMKEINIPIMSPSPTIKPMTLQTDALTLSLYIIRMIITIL